MKDRKKDGDSLEDQLKKLREGKKEKTRGARFLYTSQKETGSNDSLDLPPGTGKKNDLLSESQDKEVIQQYLDSPAKQTYPTRAGRLLRLQRYIRDIFNPKRKTDYKKHLVEDDTRPSKQERLEYMDHRLEIASKYILKNIKNISKEVISLQEKDNIIRAFKEILKDTYEYRFNARYGNVDKRYENEKYFIKNTEYIEGLARKIHGYVKSVKVEKYQESDQDLKENTQELYDKVRNFNEEKSLQEIKAMYNEIKDKWTNLKKNILSEQIKKAEEKQEQTKKDMSDIRAIDKEMQEQSSIINNRLEIISQAFHHIKNETGESEINNSEQKIFLKREYKNYNDINKGMSEMKYDMKQGLLTGLSDQWTELHSKINGEFDLEDLQFECYKQKKFLEAGELDISMLGAVLYTNESIQEYYNFIELEINKKEMENIKEKITTIVDVYPELGVKFKEELEKMKLPYKESSPHYKWFEPIFTDWRGEMTKYLEKYTIKQISDMIEDFIGLEKQYKSLQEEFNKTKGNDIEQKMKGIDGYINSQISVLREHIHKMQKFEETDNNKDFLKYMDILEEWCNTSKNNDNILKMQEDIQKYITKKV